MKLTEEQQKRIREEYGVCVDEACDVCGKILGEVRFALKDKSGEWCSASCRDGRAQAEKQAARYSLRKRVRQAKTMLSRTQNVAAGAATI